MFKLRNISLHFISRRCNKLHCTPLIMSSISSPHCCHLLDKLLALYWKLTLFSYLCLNKQTGVFSYGKHLKILILKLFSVAIPSCSDSFQNYIRHCPFCCRPSIYLNKVCCLHTQVLNKGKLLPLISLFKNSKNADFWIFCRSQTLRTLLHILYQELPIFFPKQCIQ